MLAPRGLQLSPDGAFLWYLLGTFFIKVIDIYIRPIPLLRQVFVGEIDLYTALRDVGLYQLRINCITGQESVIASFQTIEKQC